MSPDEATRSRTHVALMFLRNPTPPFKFEYKYRSTPTITNPSENFNVTLGLVIQPVCAVIVDLESHRLLKRLDIRQYRCATGHKTEERR